MREPLVLPFAALLAGIWMGRALSFSRLAAAWPAAAFCGLAFVAPRYLSRACVLLALLMAGAWTEAWHRPATRPYIEAGARESVLLEGCVVEATVITPGRGQYTLELAPGSRARVSQFFDDEKSARRFAYGQRVAIEARIRSPRNFNNPGAFDYSGYLARQHIFWTATMQRDGVVRVLPGSCGARALAVIHRIRAVVLDRIQTLYAGDSYATAMMEAILIGESSKLEKVWTENFRRTGTFHALVISGAHVAVLAAILLLLLRGCGIGEIPALAMASLAAWLYALVSGSSPPVARAAAGLTLYLAARVLFRRTRVLNLLAAVAIVYLLCDPGALFDASFQLSFLCVAALGALSTPVIERTSAPFARGMRGIANADADPHWEPRVAQFRVELRLLAETAYWITRMPAAWCARILGWICRVGLFTYDSVAVSLAIQVGLALPMAIYFHRFSFSGITANLVIVPALEVAVPLGFLAVFTHWTIPAKVAGWLLRAAAATADWHARWEPAWRLSNPPLWLAAALAVSLIVLAMAVRRGRRQWAAAAAVLVFFGILLWQPWPAAITTHSLELTAIDVGQGDSLLVVFPAGATMVVDGGGILQFGPRASEQTVPRRRRLDTGEDVVAPYLWGRGIRRLDVLVATHAHEDHSGGLLALLEDFHPRELWVGANPPEALSRRAAELHIPVLAKTASSPATYSGAQVEVLSPPAGYRAARAGNNDSLALRIAYGDHSFLLTGDLEAPMERRLLQEGRLQHTDVLKVGHHGSRTSTLQDFLDVLSPSVAVISAGFENSFGHPHPDVLHRLGQQRAAILRTDRDGLVTVRSDGHKLWLDTALWHPGSPADMFNWALSIGLD